MVRPTTSGEMPNESASLEAPRTNRAAPSTNPARPAANIKASCIAGATADSVSDSAP